MFTGEQVNITVKNYWERIANDGFWPEMNLADFVIDRDLPQNINNNLLYDALVSALVEVNLSLATFKAQQLKNGIKTARELGMKPEKHRWSWTDFSDDELRSSTEILYQKAVFARAKADLVGEFISTTNRVEKLGDNAEPIKRALLAESSRSVRQILGLKRVTVALI